MLRRHLPLGDHPDRWLLISQVEHARLSYDLASHWGNNQVSAVLSASNTSQAPLRHEWLAAVHHHDDGWGSWEADPPIDPQEGRPYSFLDMPREAALDIWRDSIYFARRHGLLAGWCVARHFAELLRGSRDAEQSLSRQWLAEMESLAEGWLGEWLAQDSGRQRSLAERGLAGLQFFDWLSLWLCLHCPGASEEGGSEPGQMQPGWDQSPSVELVAAMTQTRGEARQVAVRPWPFDVEELHVEVLGYAIPTGRYSSESQMIERRIPHSLAWHLVPTS
jgi:hypothetical protein